MSMDILRAPDCVCAFTDSGEHILIKNGTCFEGAGVYVKTDGDLVIVSAGSQELLRVALRWNGSWAPGTRFLGDAFERAYGDLAWRGIETENSMAWYFLAACGKHCTGYGVKTNPGALCFWTVDGEGATLWLDVQNGADGVILNGRELLAAVLVQDESDSMSAFHFQQRFCRKLCDHPLLPQRPVYGGNNWCYAYGDSSAEQILKDSTLMKLCAEGLENRPFMVIDDCWQELARLSGSGAQGRPYERGNAMFPDMPGLADEMKQMGVRPGIWMRPLRTAEKYIDSNLIVPRPEDRWHIFLDPSLDAVHELISEDIARIRGWGYELIKYDFVQHDIMGDFGRTNHIHKMKGWHFHDRSRTNAEIMTRVSKTIYDAADSAELIGCNVCGHLAAGYISMHRSGDDTSGREYSRSVKMGVNALGFRLGQNDAFFRVDPDCVCLTDKVPIDKNLEILDLFSRAPVPLFVSLQPEVADDKVLSALKDAFARASEQNSDAEPLDWMDTAMPAMYRIDGGEYRYHWAPEAGYPNILMS